QALRRATGAGMMDAKKALEANNGDPEAAAKWLRERGLAKADKRHDRPNTEGAVAVSVTGNQAAIAELKSETDFVAKSEPFTSLVEDIAALVASKGEEAAREEKAAAVDDMKLRLQENIELGRVLRIDAAEGHVVDSYVHRQDGRGVNAVIVELDGGTAELAHEVAVHIAFTRPAHLRREDVPADEVAEERQTLENITRAEGKPEAAMGKILEGRLNGWFKERVLLEQGYVKDEKQTIGQLLGDVAIVAFAQVVIGS
ncbi:MAG: translation elongation factor Ts, partial [Acidimicrobiia bacterium]|nr:translation elongation factor Ts [Acidimicrobiia bacterium]